MRPRTIREFMSVDFVRVQPDTSVAGARALMRSSNMRDLVVMDGDKLAGVLSQLDLYLIQTLTEARYGSAVVVDDEQVVGIFTTADALLALSQVLAAETGDALDAATLIKEVDDYNGNERSE